jgi:hypothetical protein
MSSSDVFGGDSLFHSPPPLSDSKEEEDNEDNEDNEDQVVVDEDEVGEETNLVEEDDKMMIHGEDDDVNLNRVIDNGDSKFRLRQTQSLFGTSNTATTFQRSVVESKY